MVSFQQFRQTFGRTNAFSLLLWREHAIKWLTLYATVFPIHRSVISFHHVFDVYTWHYKIITLDCLSNTIIFFIFAVSTLTTEWNAFIYICVQRPYWIESRLYSWSFSLVWYCRYNSPKFKLVIACFHYLKIITMSTNLQSKYNIKCVKNVINDIT